MRARQGEGKRKKAKREGMSAVTRRQQCDTVLIVRREEPGDLRHETTRRKITLWQNVLKGQSIEIVLDFSFVFFLPDHHGTE